MKKFLLSLLLGLLNKFVISIVFNIASPIVFAFISKFSTGDWFKLLHNPLIDCIFGLLLVWFVAVLFIKSYYLEKIIGLQILICLGLVEKRLVHYLIKR
ncbi:hypothetical protein [Bacillus halotolerans]|uniref:hypothetical protein n=1 Tax=Bacillus halotolerans TaxID=260554 RepID=UPI00192CAFD4|nr:hypothetical protein [Bacillus halotolerans]MBL4978685.1 hypothetical protein [Bacillus halotolerans]